MQRRRLGTDGPLVGPIAFGAMSFAGYYGAAEQEEGIRAINRALDLGINLIDTAEAYGNGSVEALVGRAIEGRRDEVVLSTKASRGSRDYLRRALERSLGRLGTDRVDLYFLHRVDAEVPIEESVAALAELVEEGLVGAIGLSEAGPGTIRRAHAVHPIAALQTEYSLLERHAERELLPVVRELGMSFVAYSPLARGLLGGRIRRPEDLAPDDWRHQVPRFQGENLVRNLALVDALAEIAAERETTLPALALAWLLAQGPEVIPLVGSSKAAHVERSLDALEVELDAFALARIDGAAPAGAARGERYPADYLPALGR